MAKEEKTVEEVAKDINTSIEGLKSSIKDKADMSVLEERLEGVTSKLNKLFDKDGNTVVPEHVEKQQKQLDEIATQLKQLDEFQKGKGKSRIEQISEQIKSESFKEQIKTKSGMRQGIDLEIKTADIDTDDINSGTIETQTETGVSKAPWRNTPLWDNINKGVVGQGRDSISWWEETTRTDSAGAIAENAAPTTGSAKTWTKQSMDIKMIKDFTKVSRSVLEDFEYITSEVNDLMTNGIPREREDQILSGSGLTIYLKGVDEYYKTFACPANFNKVVSANEGDVLAAAVLQVMNGNTGDTKKRGYMPSIIVLNPGDSTNMRELKNANESYIRHPMLSANGDLFRGVRIVESLDLAAGQFIVGDFSRAKAYVKRNMNISFHYENEDDVLSDKVLVLASMRIAGLKITAPDTYAFVGGTFSAGKALIEKVTG